MGHPCPKLRGYLGHQKLCGEASGSKQGISPLQGTARELFHNRQLQKCLPTFCTHRASGLMISRPGGRGYKARILSHKARSHGSTTASGLQVGNSGCSRAVSSLQAQALLPRHRDNAGPHLQSYLCFSFAAQSLCAVPFQLQGCKHVSAPLSSHSLSGAQCLSRTTNPPSTAVDSHCLQVCDTVSLGLNRARQSQETLAHGGGHGTPWRSK